jgi:hypothetical protein
LFGLLLGSTFFISTVLGGESFVVVVVGLSVVADLSTVCCSCVRTVSGIDITTFFYLRVSLHHSQTLNYQFY